mmetsp:Transcript_29673/g.47889  ORF Transcript_29673/g.47889 Transcript_29673/m.47889 type:complete len:642 (+) Transcript_29673:183-2108(+)
MLLLQSIRRLCWLHFNLLVSIVLAGSQQGSVTLGGDGRLSLAGHSRMQVWGNLTIESWVKIYGDFFPMNNLFYFANYDGLTSDDLGLRWLNESSIEVRVGKAQAVSVAIFGLKDGPILANTWMHFAVTLEASGGISSRGDDECIAHLYVDGVDQGCARQPEGPILCPPEKSRKQQMIGPPNIPLLPDSLENVMSLGIDEFRIWTVARTAEEIAAFRSVSIRQRFPSLLLNYVFDDFTCLVGPPDLSGNSFTGTCESSICSTTCGEISLWSPELPFGISVVDDPTPTPRKTLAIALLERVTSNGVDPIIVGSAVGAGCAFGIVVIVVMTVFCLRRKGAAMFDQKRGSTIFPSVDPSMFDQEQDPEDIRETFHITKGGGKYESNINSSDEIPSQREAYGIGMPDRRCAYPPPGWRTSIVKTEAHSDDVARPGRALVVTRTSADDEEQDDAGLLRQARAAHQPSADKTDHAFLPPTSRSRPTLLPLVPPVVYLLRPDPDDTTSVPQKNPNPSPALSTRQFYVFDAGPPAPGLTSHPSSSSSSGQVSESVTPEPPSPSTESSSSSTVLPSIESKEPLAADALSPPFPLSLSPPPNNLSSSSRQNRVADSSSPLSTQLLSPTPDGRPLNDTQVPLPTANKEDARLP